VFIARHEIKTINKTENKTYHSVGTIPKSYIKIVERVEITHSSGLIYVLQCQVKLVLLLETKDGNIYHKFYFAN
jgi:hypothetical protein